MLDKLRNSTTVCIIIAVVFGTIAGYVDVNASEVQPAALLIIIFTCFLGFIQPRNAWVAALLVGSSILVAHLLSPVLGYHTMDPVEPNIWETSIALVPAFLGAYIGAAAGWAISSTRSKA